jgi:hypothetical protein
MPTMGTVMAMRGAVVIPVAASDVDAARVGAEVVRTPVSAPLCRSNHCHPLPGVGVVGVVGPCQNALAPMEAAEATIGMGDPILPPA